MLGVTDLRTYVLGTIAIILLPGPNSLYVLATAAKQGVRTGYRAACGVFLGDGVLMFASAAGAASLLRTFPPLFTVLKLAGAAYLAYLGIKLLANALRPSRSGPAPALDASHPFRRALVISLMNPKAILFFVSFFIQFVDPAYPHPALSFALLAAILQVFSAVYLTVLIFGGSWLAEAFRKRRRAAAAGTALIGTLFIGFALKLATS